MSNIESMFEDIFEVVSNRSSVAVAKSESMEAMDSKRMDESFRNLPSGPQEEFLLQDKIRPIFGKAGVNKSPIGTHPDFIYLEGTTTTQYHYVCTIFVDIKGSTRLSLLYPLDFVYKFKNAVIQTCVEIIRSFDGYVHRLMGDAVMAFFGSSSTEKENAIADAINCSVTLRAILEESIKPWMERQGLDAKDFGFRVGCDFGNDEDVLWGNFGYRNVGEVSATGLPVDMASKLQGLAGKNQTMLGQGLLDFVNWPEKYSKIKTRGRENEIENLLVVTPNITDLDGNALNYRMKQLSYEKSLEFSALPRSFRENICGSLVKDHTEIDYKCFTVIDGEKKEYISASGFLEPNVSLVFEVQSRTNNRLRFPLKVVFRKTNHGPATPKDERDVEQEGVVKHLHKNRISQYNRSYSPISKVELSEATLYRGLHTMKCEVYDSNGVLHFRDWIGVMIK
ncbi:nucleotide-binding domain-containing protein [Billgrantia kenyensis]|uniref:Adenylate/guanylate cyclase domain-containing protein n=1 Tax=Billgrantia kenyensis TaxID=321266 RepID=A0A7W0AFD2_9GAMM|nr:adenylate/guanylate cyclase domain-containing protein [Halomonas kenyensis]MBA2781266.1 adenylate/guanylate cyclase domain-containing protein [Halomonas kenyensis]MCG6663930.1 adenylate/guanylate cyclase domain-containing protein [Halomonas kenyensis]